MIMINIEVAEAGVFVLIVRQAAGTTGAILLFEFCLVPVFRNPVTPEPFVDCTASLAVVLQAILALCLSAEIG